MFVNTRSTPPANLKKAEAALARAIIDIYDRGERNEVRLAVLGLARLDQQERETYNRRPGAARRTPRRPPGPAR
jgi:hypothetical protein